MLRSDAWNSSPPIGSKITSAPRPSVSALMRPAHVLARGVDHRLRAARCGDGEMIRAARGGDHARAQRPAAFDGREADAAGGAVHHERLARLQATGPAERAIGGAVGDREPGGGHVVHCGGQADDVLDRAHRRLGEAAVAQRRHHPVARGEAGDAGAAGVDAAGDLHARHERQRRLLLVLAPDDQRVGEVEPGRAHPDAHLARPRLRGRDLPDDQAVQSGQLLANDSTHDHLARVAARLASRSRSLKRAVRSPVLPAGGATCPAPSTGRDRPFVHERPAAGWPERAASLSPLCVQTSTA